MELDLLFCHWGQPCLCHSSGLLGFFGEKGISNNLILKYD